MYTEQQVCQKHYFRFMRNGTYEIVRKRGRIRYQDSSGYWKLYMPDHPLSDSTGYVWEHRKIVYDRIGDTVPPCELCGKFLSWANAVVDHIDEVKGNNDPTNLRPLCHGCNTWRGKRIPQHQAKGRYAITFDGETKTPAEWARDPRVKVAGHTIMVRKRNGMSDHDALFSPKQTHTGFRKPPPPPKPKHHRSNAIALTINGVTKTAMEWSREPGCTVCDGTIRMRLKQGWDHERAVFEPAKAAGGIRGSTVRNARGQFENPLQEAA